MKVPDDAHCLFPTSKRPGASLAQFGVKAFITVDGQPLKVYEATETGGLLTGSVQAEVGKEFEVVFYDGRKADAKGKKTGYDVSICFGKQRIAGFYSKLSRAKSKRELESEKSRRFWTFGEVRINDDHVRKFRFSPVATTDDAEEACSDVDFLNNISTVTVEYRRIKQAPRTKKTEEEKKQEKEKRKKKAEEKTNRPKVDPGAAVDDRKISEKSDKGNFAIDPGFGAPVVSKTASTTKGRGKGKRKKPSTWQYVFIDENKVDLKFVFRIRSEAYIDQLERRNSGYDETDPNPFRDITPPVELSRNVLLLDFDDDEIAAEANAQGVQVPKKLDVKEEDEEDEDEEDEEEEESGSEAEGDADGDGYGREGALKIEKMDDGPSSPKRRRLSSSSALGVRSGPLQLATPAAPPLSAPSFSFPRVKPEPASGPPPSVKHGDNRNGARASSSASFAFPAAAGGSFSRSGAFDSYQQRAAGRIEASQVKKEQVEEAKPEDTSSPEVSADEN